MKIFALPVFFLLVFTSCDMAHKIDQSSNEINRNTCAVERSTQAIYRNMQQLEKAEAS